MIPIRDHSNTFVTPLVTYSIIALNVAVFLFMYLIPVTELDNLVAKYAFIPKDIISGKHYYTLFTSMFIHGGLGHIFSNMIFLNVFGDNMEAAFGRIKYLLFYLVCGVAASLLQIFVDPASSIPNLGASGAIAGLLGGYLVLFPKHKIDVLIPLGFYFREASVSASFMLVYWIIFQFISGFGSLGIGGGVAYFAHIGGFICGICITVFVKAITRRG
jgi:membrane associated rhomboid family serine protease